MLTAAPSIASTFVLVSTTSSSPASRHSQVLRSIAGSVPVTGWMNLTLAHNTGAAFSLFADAAGWQRWFFIVVASGISVFLVIWLWRLPLSARLLPAALMLILGGAIGNLVDRVRLGYVVDFIDLHYNNWHWPAFNLADSAIVIGVTLMLVESLLPPRKPPEKLDGTL